MSTLNFQCTCGQWIIQDGENKAGDTAQCGKCRKTFTIGTGHENSSFVSFDYVQDLKKENAALKRDLERTGEALNGKSINYRDQHEQIAALKEKLSHEIKLRNKYFDQVTDFELQASQLAEALERIKNGDCIPGNCGGSPYEACNCSMDLAREALDLYRKDKEK